MNQHYLGRSSPYLGMLFSFCMRNWEQLFFWTALLLILWNIMYLAPLSLLRPPMRQMAPTGVGPGLGANQATAGFKLQIKIGMPSY